MEEVPLRNDPEKEVKDKENQETKMEIDDDPPRDKSAKRIKADDYAKWEKFDVVSDKFLTMSQVLLGVIG